MTTIVVLKDPKKHQKTMAERPVFRTFQLGCRTFHLGSSEDEQFKLEHAASFVSMSRTTDLRDLSIWQRFRRASSKSICQAIAFSELLIYKSTKIYDGVLPVKKFADRCLDWTHLPEDTRILGLASNDFDGETDFSKLPETLMLLDIQHTKMRGHMVVSKNLRAHVKSSTVTISRTRNFK